MTDEEQVGFEKLVHVEMDAEPSIPDTGPTWFSGYGDTLLILVFSLILAIEAIYFAGKFLRG
jgi:hypothetical protein